MSYPWLRDQCNALFESFPPEYKTAVFTSRSLPRRYSLSAVLSWRSIRVKQQTDCHFSYTILFGGISTVPEEFGSSRSLNVVEFTDITGIVSYPPLKLVGLQLGVVWCDLSNPSSCQTRLLTYTNLLLHGSLTLSTLPGSLAGRLGRRPHVRVQCGAGSLCVVIP